MAIVKTPPNRLGFGHGALISQQRTEPWSPQEASVIRNAIENSAHVQRFSRRMLATVANATPPSLSGKHLILASNQALGFNRGWRALVFVPSWVKKLRAQGVYWTFENLAAVESLYTIRNKLGVDPTGSSVPQEGSVTDLVTGNNAQVSGGDWGTGWRVGVPTEAGQAQLDELAALMRHAIVAGPICEVDVTTPSDLRGALALVELSAELRLQRSSDLVFVGVPWTPIAASIWWEMDSAADTTQDAGEVVTGAPILVPHLLAAIEQSNWAAAEIGQALWSVDFDILGSGTAPRGLPFTSSAFRILAENTCRVALEPTTVRAAVVVEVPAATTCEVQVTLGALSVSMILTSIDSNKIVQIPSFTLGSPERGRQPWNVQVRRLTGSGTCVLHQGCAFEVPMAAGSLQPPAND